MTLQYSDKHYLIPSSTWEKLRDGAVGGPQLSLKKTYQDFMEKQRAEANQTDQKWTALSKRVTPLLDDVISRNRNGSALEQSLLIDRLKPKAKALYQSLEKISGVEIDWGASKIFVDNHALDGNITSILKQLITKRNGNVTNLIPLLRKLYPVRNKIVNEAALNWINDHGAPAPAPRGTPTNRRRTGKGTSAVNPSKGKGPVRNLNESLFSPADHENTPSKSNPSSTSTPPARKRRPQKSSSEPPARQGQKSRIPEPSESGDSQNNNKSRRHRPRKTPFKNAKVKFELPDSPDDNTLRGSGPFQPRKQKRKQISWKSLF